jgi:quercetin dioxygenase-like cupin family protein
MFVRTQKTRIVTAVSGALLAGVAALAAAQPAITRTVLQRADLTTPGHEAVTARADFPVGGTTGRHTHPGDEVSYVVEGTVTLEIDGAPAKTLKAGEVFFVPAGKVHSATAAGGKAIVIANYLVEKGKPLTAAVP